MILVADNLQILHGPIRKAVETLDPEPIRSWARRLEDAGADAIDINAGPGLSRPEKEMRFLVETVQNASSLPILIDTANPGAMAAGLRIAQGRPILNGCSLEPFKLESILPLAAEADADLIVYLLGSNGHILPDADSRLEAAIELYSLSRSAGLSPDRLIIDPVVVPLSWQDGIRQAREVLSAVRALPDLLGFPVRTIAGLSNLTAGAPRSDSRQAMESAYLSMLSLAGLQMVLLNIFRKKTVQTARACRSLTTGHVFSWNQIPE